MLDRPAPAAAPAVAVPDRSDEPMLRRSDALGLASHFDAAWLRFAGRPPEALLRNGWLDDIHPDDRARCRSIHLEMRGPQAPYSLDYRLRHGQYGYRWLMEHAVPVIARDGSFDGFVHHCIDIHERTELAEDLADRLGRVRKAARSHGAFASALAGELAQLPTARIRIALELFAALAGQPGRPQASRRTVAEWLGRIVEAARAELPPGAASISLALPVEPLDIDFDATTLSDAFTHALVCTALRTGAEAVQVHATRFDGALLLDLPARTGSSAFTLLELALRAQGLSGGQVVQQGMPRWRVALPLAGAEHGL